jgi:hypothetical protein
MMNWKDLEGSGHDLIKALSWYLPGEAKKIMKTLVRIGSVLAQIWTKHLWNITALHLCQPILVLMLLSWQIWGSYSAEYKEYGLMECYTMSFDKELPIFWRNPLPTPSGHITKMKAACNSKMLIAIYETIHHNIP